MEKTYSALQLGKKIRQARKEAGISSQSDLAKLCGWNGADGQPAQTRVSNYENGTREAGLQEIQKIAEVTGKQVSFFYDVNTGQVAEKASLNEASLTPGQARLFNALQRASKLNKKDLDRLSALLEAYIDNS